MPWEGLLQSFGIPYSEAAKYGFHGFQVRNQGLGTRVLMTKHHDFQFMLRTSATTLPP